ncbi:type IV pilin protein [Paraherbaspirillum soli]|uniref:Type IV pilin protein n=1 Tax=Paraherbaspirillum soli TaxID=631222 RepID=A0ABW0MCL2_9BURK
MRPSRSSMQAKVLRIRGFSLIELMIVVAIVGILARVAYPSYLSYVRKAHRADAMATLAQQQTILERCYAQTFDYSKACAALPIFPLVSSQGFYSIALSNQAASTYTLTATATGTQAADTTCATMSVDQASQKLAKDSSGNAQSVCWNP